MRSVKFIPVLVIALVTAMTAYAKGEEKEFVYHQKTGKLTLDGKDFGEGYSGKKDKGKNNPDKEKEKNVGPIPQGLYQIGKAKAWKGMENVFDLAPDGHDAHGRTDFLIH